MALLAAGGFFSVRRWVALVAERTDRLWTAIPILLFTAGLALFNWWDGNGTAGRNGVVAALCLLTAGLAYQRVRREWE